MPLVSGFRLGPYEVISPLGAGGMGEVYRATDTRLDRTVAIKVLPPDVAHQPDLRARFEREARVVSALNHPHICTLYDIGRQGDIDYIVMELVEGQTLADRLVRGPLPLKEALKCAMQIADALDKAHRQGIVHRDLKPGNIMLTPAGAKLLDFGLAKTGGPVNMSGSVSLLATAATAAPDITAQGTILGTLQYMSPEQLEGGNTDARTDIFAFGATLYEMVSGRKAFQGKSQVSLMAAILEHDPPPLSSVQQLTPPALDHVVKTCLAKNPDERWQTAGDLLLQLKWIAETGGGSAVTAAVPPSVGRPKWIERAMWSVAVIAAGAIVGMILRPAKAPAGLPTMRFDISLPITSSSYQFSVSPDGKYVVTAAVSDKGPMLSLHAFDGSERFLPETDRGADPFWSADSRSIGFYEGNKLKTIDLSGAPPKSIGDALGGGGGAWSQDGFILFCRRNAGIYRIAASGGPVQAVTELDKSLAETAHVGPKLLPDGKHFLFLALSNKPENNNIVYIASLDSKARTRIVDSTGWPTFAPPDVLLFTRGNTLLAQSLNLSSFELMGDARPILTGIGNGTISRPGFSASQNGVLVARQGLGDNQLMRFSRSDSKPPDVLLSQRYINPALSPNGQMIAAEAADSGGGDIWLLDLSRNTPTRFTFSDARDSSPIWSPDGQQIVFASDRDGPSNLYVKSAAGAIPEEPLLKNGFLKLPTDWNGNYVLYEEQNPTTLFDVWALPMSGDRKPFPVLNTAGAQRRGRLSPDGHWLAYESNESGLGEIYVQTFPVSEHKWKISTNGGAWPRWRGDGKELFFYAPTAGVESVAIKRASPPDMFEVGLPELVSTLVAPGGQGYDVTPDGQSFLVGGRPRTTSGSALTVVLNWASALSTK